MRIAPPVILLGSDFGIVRPILCPPPEPYPPLREPLPPSGIRPNFGESPPPSTPTSPPPINSWGFPWFPSTLGPGARLHIDGGRGLVHQNDAALRQTTVGGIGVGGGAEKIPI